MQTISFAFIFVLLTLLNFLIIYILVNCVKAWYYEEKIADALMELKKELERKDKKR